MSKKKAPKSMKIDPNTIKTRDYLLLKIIGGATKAGVYTDRKKEENKRKSRQKVRREDEE